MLVKFLKGLGIYLLVAYTVWMVLAGMYGWVPDLPGMHWNEADNQMCFVVFPIAALCWPLVILARRGGSWIGRKLGRIGGSTHANHSGG